MDFWHMQTVWLLKKRYLTTHSWLFVECHNLVDVRHFKDVFMWEWCGFSSVIDLLQASYQGLKEAREKVKEEKPIPAEVYARFLYMHFDMKAWTQCSPLKNILCLAILYACPIPDETVCVACLCMPYRLHLKRSKQHWNLRPEAMRLSRRKITCLQLMHTHRSLIIFCFPTEKVCNECCMFFLQ